MKTGRVIDIVWGRKKIICFSTEMQQYKYEDWCGQLFTSTIEH